MGQEETRKREEREDGWVVDFVAENCYTVAGGRRKLESVAAGGESEEAEMEEFVGKEKLRRRE